ncbi:hypothetical protein AVEN_159766-1 [Araneus ventricosus]|uniref:Uncharacterized protein n=1 Tax=Araneus ventricosus TaxID=182803 RepID=A0A4Y2DCR8_ARAVE|nr:hypothetical protein AVEN_159766-1 [Araneus ventricosus]
MYIGTVPVLFKAGHSLLDCLISFGPTTGLFSPIQADPFWWVIHEDSTRHYRFLRSPYSSSSLQNNTSCRNKKSPTYIPLLL